MKHSSSQSASRRSTRASTRRKKEELERQDCEKNRAEYLMSSPQFKALSFVLSSGYLYRYECIGTSLTCQNWYHIWNGTKDEFPQDSKVKITCEDIGGNTSDEPFFILENNLVLQIQTPEFARQIFDKIINLKLAAKKGTAARKKFLKSLPVWGVDVTHVTIDYWGQNSHNGGGIAITYKRYIGSSPQHYRSVFMVRLSPDLRLWTGIRTWSVYDYNPLWP